ncbi:MAG: lamin tail domain-containing protein, partial [Planctomycetota bacterium]
MEWSASEAGELKVLNSIKITLLSIVLIALLADSVVAADCPVGDLSGNCRVWWEDVQLFVKQWLDTGGCSEPNCADLDDNNNVDITDFAILALHWNESNMPLIVINEIHYRPDLKVEQVEFVELYNSGDETIDLSGWYFSRGIDFTFPPGTSLDPNSYLVVVEDSYPLDPNNVNDADFVAKWPSVTPVGVFTGKLDNDGENVEL